MNIFQSADILLPRSANMEKWAVIACDQFTSDLAYWKRVRETAGEAESTIHLILPEAELENDQEVAVQKINASMQRYLDENVFEARENAYIYVERTLINGMIRKGLIGAVDLEAYDYNPGSVSLIRATEKTVLERIPPRQKVRKDAPLEFPHVLMLCDDAERVLVESVEAVKDTLPVIYDFDLMEGGGHITGWLVQGEAAAAFDTRFSEYSKTFEEKYADLEGAKVLLAVGDGNHSLATAKSCYEALKASTDEDVSNHPARYALVELENIHDEAQQFEPIHRILTDVDADKLFVDISSICANEGFEITWVQAGEKKTLFLDAAKGELAVAILQNFLDAWMQENPCGIDYIHGDEELVELTRAENAVGFLLPAMEKHQLFRGVISGGVLPRKTFSMGHAREKRYYLEGRKIK